VGCLRLGPNTPGVNLGGRSQLIGGPQDIGHLVRQ
jgi:hypothetical protein